MLPLTPYEVNFTLHAIHNLASEPLPSHLISQPLHQRHHFLNLTPHDSIAYLSWPSPDGDNELAVKSLLYVGEPDAEATFPIRYSGDQESYYAHAEVPLRTTADSAISLRPIRLVFQWDPKSNIWAYHNVSLMPFPPSAKHRDIQEFIATQNMDATDVSESRDCDGDSYWDSYGNEDAEVSQDTSHSKGAVQSEDAYWAQYASVQGSADSTIPSPLPTSRHRPQHAVEHTLPLYHLPGGHDSLEPPSIAELNSHEQHKLDRRAHNDLLVTIPFESFAHSRLTDKLSPYALADRLEALGVHGARVLGLEDEDAQISPQNGHLESTQTQNRKDTYWNGFGAPSKEEIEVDGVDSALKAAIQGLYHLWLSSSPKRRQPEDFLSIVGQVVRDDAKNV